MSEVGRNVLALKASGLASAEIAHRLGIAQSTVHYHVRKAAAPPPEAPAKRRPRKAHTEVETRERVAALLAEGLKRSEVAQRLGLSKSTVSYHARRLGLEIDSRFRRRYDWAAIQAGAAGPAGTALIEKGVHYDAGHGVRECMRVFGFSSASWHDAVQRGVIRPRPAFRPLDEVFARNTKRNRGHLKKRLLLAGIKRDACERCGLTEWLGRPLSISLHHVNGDRTDNRVENLELLCPNCHSQTDTFSGRNGRRPLTLVSDPPAEADADVR